MRKSILTLSGVVLFLSSISVYGGQTIDTDCIQKSEPDSPTVVLGDLVHRDELYFRKFSVCPFTGWVKGKTVRGWIRDGKKDGEWITFWDNGQLKSKGLWLSGVRQGPWVWYFSDGDPSQNGSFLNGEKHGSWKVYWDNPSEIIYEDGQFLSVPVESETNYFSVGQYENGKRVGELIRYHQNGGIDYKGRFNKNSKREGPWVYYFSTGQVDTEGSYKNGIRDGTWFDYNLEGELLKKTVWKDGYIVEELGE